MMADRQPTLGELAIMAEDLIEQLEKQNRSLIDQLRAAENQIIAYKEVFKVIRRLRGADRDIGKREPVPARSTEGRTRDYRFAGKRH
jgi:hypothetical protein